MKHADVLQQIDTLLPTPGGDTQRLIPTSFDPDDPTLRGYPIDNNWQWVSCATALKEFEAVGVMMRIPLFWQLEVPLFSACKSAEAFIFVSDRGNIPLALEAIRTAEIDTVVTDSDDARAFYSFIREKNQLPPRSWILIYHATLPNEDDEGIISANIAREVHIFPGVPLLEQCKALRSGQSKEFHMTDEFAWHGDDNTVSSSPTGHTIIPLTHYQLPFHLQEVGTCSCGRSLFRGTAQSDTKHHDI